MRAANVRKQPAKAPAAIDLEALHQLDDLRLLGTGANLGRG
jgi:hypothetical protein